MVNNKYYDDNTYEHKCQIDWDRIAGKSKYDDNESDDLEQGKKRRNDKSSCEMLQVFLFQRALPP